MKKLLLLCFIACFSLQTWAQTSNNKIVFNIKKAATSIKFVFRLTANANSITVNFGEGEETKAFTGTSDSLKTAEYTFKQTSDTERTIEVDATNLFTLRVISNKSINGIKSIVSDKLENLNFDYTDLSAYPTVDLSQCPALKVATFNESKLEKIILPAGDIFQDIQATGDWLGAGNLKEINLQDAKGLKSIGIKNAAISKIDLSNCANLETLVFSMPLSSTPLRTIVGAKSLKKLTQLDVRKNSLGFDQIPDLVAENVELEQWQYSAQGSYRVDASKVNGSTVDVSNLLEGKGVSTTTQLTEYKWFWRATKNDTYVAVPSGSYTELAGKFTFDPTALGVDEFQVYFQASNPGFPGIGNKKDYISSYLINLKKTSTDIQTTEAEKRLQVTPTANGIVAKGKTNSQAVVYGLGGQQVWTGTLPATIVLPQGYFIIQSNGQSIKFTR